METRKIGLLDEVTTPDGKVGKVTEFDQVDGHTTAKVIYPSRRFEWFKTSDLRV